MATNPVRDEADNQNQVHRTTNCARDASASKLQPGSFEFDQEGRVVDCIGTIKPGGNVDHDYTGSGLARLYETARRRFTARQGSSTTLQFPNGARLANA